TNRDLAAAISSQAFREDLYYRLNVFQIHLAPLRERREDIMPLAEAFLDDLGARMGRRPAGISPDARDWLLAYRWPGNVREMRNAIERAILLWEEGLITRAHLPAPPADRAATSARDLNAWLDPGIPLPVDGIDFEAIERVLIEKALGQAKGNKTRAARLLGLTRAKLYARLEKHALPEGALSQAGHWGASVHRIGISRSRTSRVASRAGHGSDPGAGRLGSCCPWTDSGPARRTGAPRSPDSGRRPAELRRAQTPWPRAAPS